MISKRDVAMLGVNIASKELGISDIKVEFRPQSFFKNEDNNAIFVGKLYTIVFSDDWLNQAHDLEILRCAFHETRHAYQKACIDFPELVRLDVSKDVVIIWEKEFDTYIDPRFAGYLDQEIEKDAVAFSEKLLKSIGG